MGESIITEAVIRSDRHCSFYYRYDPALVHQPSRATSFSVSSGELPGELSLGPPCC